VIVCVSTGNLSPWRPNCRHGESAWDLDEIEWTDCHFDAFVYFGVCARSLVRWPEPTCKAWKGGPCEVTP